MNPKTGRLLKIVCLIVCAASLLLLLLLLGWFYVRGAEFRFLEDLPTDCEVTFGRQALHSGSEEYELEEFTVTKEQLDEALALLKKNAYWRMLSRSISHNEDTIYYIFFEFSQESKEEYLVVSFVGGYAVSIDSSVEEFTQDGFLRILNRNFLSELESIIAP